MTPDPEQKQAMRELLVVLLRAYGVTADLSGLDNTGLKKELERVFWGIAK